MRNYDPGGISRVINPVLMRVCMCFCKPAYIYTFGLHNASNIISVRLHNIFYIISYKMHENEKHAYFPLLCPRKSIIVYIRRVLLFFDYFHESPMRKERLCMEKKLGFIGAGNMAGAIINGVISTGTYPASLISVYDISAEKCAGFQRKGISVSESSVSLVENSDIIFLAVKPQNFAEVLEGIRTAVTKDKIFVTIAAGISANYITSTLQCECPVVRVMPNTPLLIGKGASAVSRNQYVPEDSFALICSFFASCGTVTLLGEESMNAVISVNGSGPAYVYLFAKAMIDGAVQQGIPKETALQLVCQTLEGSAGMLKDSGNTPEELIKMVSSPGGTTLKALEVFYQEGFEKTVINAMLACTERAEELGK